MKFIYNSQAAFIKVTVTVFLFSLTLPGNSIQASISPAPFAVDANSARVFLPSQMKPIFISRKSDPVQKSAFSKNLRPQWAAKTCFEQSENGSYLSLTGVMKQESLNDQVFTDAGAVRVLRAEYEDRVEADEYQANAGLAESSQEKTRFESMKDLARRAVDTFSKLRLRIEGDHIKKSAQNSVAREPMAVAVLAASLYTGRAMNFKIGNGVRMTSTTAVKNRAASLSMHLPSPGLTSTVGYNPENQLSAQLSQRISNRVSAMLDSAKKGSAQIVYSVSF